MSDNNLNIKNLSIGYQTGKRKKTLAEGITVKAKKGELVALIGANGTGKSTFLRTLCRLQPALLGDVFIQDKNILQQHPKQIARKVSLVSTELYRTGKLKVLDLVQLGRYPYGNSFFEKSQNDTEIVMDSLSQVGMQDFADRFITELSDGEYQRVMIARALAQDTPVMILDEPTAFLDLANKFSVVELIWNLCKKHNKTIIYSTHDINIALQYADVFWVFNKNNLSAGAPEDMLINKTIEHLFQDKDLVFDIDTTQFVKNKTYNICVGIHGEGKVLKITKLALQRLGVATKCNKNQAVNVFIKNINKKNIWFVVNEKQKTECASIYELQNIINKILLL
jgi:iron complex transport system ATP-binding protein